MARTELQAGEGCAQALRPIRSSELLRQLQASKSQSSSSLNRWSTYAAGEPLGGVHCSPGKSSEAAGGFNFDGAGDSGAAIGALAAEGVGAISI